MLFFIFDFLFLIFVTNACMCRRCFSHAISTLMNRRKTCLASTIVHTVARTRARRHLPKPPEDRLLHGTCLHKTHVALHRFCVALVQTARRHIASSHSLRRCRWLAAWSHPLLIISFFFLFPIVTIQTLCNNHPLLLLLVTVTPLLLILTV